MDQPQDPPSIPGCFLKAMPSTTPGYPPWLTLATNTPGYPHMDVQEAHSSSAHHSVTIPKTVKEQAQCKPNKWKANIDHGHSHKQVPARSNRLLATALLWKKLFSLGKG